MKTAKFWKIAIMFSALWLVPSHSFAENEAKIKSYYISADIALRRMNLNKATEFLDKLTDSHNFESITASQQQEIYHMAARTYLMAGDYEKAIDLKKYKGFDGLPHVLIGLQALRHEWWKEASFLLERGKRISATEDDHVWRGWVLPMVKVWTLAGQKKVGQAFANLHELKEIDNLADIYFLQEILLHLHLRQPQAVLRKFESGSVSDEFLAYYLQALALAGRHEEAREILRTAEPSQDRFFNEVRHALENGIDIEASLVSPNQALSYLFLYFAELYSFNHPHEALLYSRLALLVGEQDFEIFDIMAEAFSDYGDYSSAIEVWQDFKTEDDSVRILVSLQIAEYLFQLGDYGGAEALLLSLRRNFPSDISLRDALGFHYLRQDLYEMLIDFYGGEDLVSDDLRDWHGFYLRGIAYEHLGMWDLAESDLLIANDLSPNNPYIMNYLGYSWLDRGEHLQEAFHLLRRAVDLRGDDGSILDSLGWAYYRLGDHANSVIYLERAVLLSPSISVIVDHLGDAYWQVGRKLEAHFQWRRALGLDDMTDDLRVIILQKLGWESGGGY